MLRISFGRSMPEAVQEELVGGRRRVAVVLVERAVQFVGAALGHQRHLRAGGAAAVGVGVHGGDAELLHRIRGHAQDAGEGVAVHLVVDVHAVQRDVGLVALAAVDRAVAVVGVVFAW